MDPSLQRRCLSPGLLLLLSTFSVKILPVEGVCDIIGTKVNCDSRGLTSLPSDLPHDMTMLSFSNNKLRRLNSKLFHNFLFLELIDFSNNNIEEIAVDAFEGLLSLLTLKLQQNRISNLKPRSFIDLQRVATIDMSNNPLGAFPVDVFEDCIWLSRLELQYTGFDERSFAKFEILPKLNYLNLSGNRFSYLPYLMLQHFSSLSHLELNNCSVQSIDPNAFVGLHGLRTLTLADNRFSHLTREVFQPLQLAFLELKGNPLECDCGMSHFQDWMEMGVFIGSQSCTSSDGKVYNIITDDLSGFCTSIGPPMPDPCAGQGQLAVHLTKVTHDEVEVQWTSSSIPNSLALSANLRIYAEKDTETWETMAISRRSYTFKRLKERSQYVLCMIQRQCELYACLDFSTKDDPQTGAVQNPDCVSVELTAGIAVGTAFLMLAVGVVSACLLLQGLCCCCAQAQRWKDLSPIVAGPVRRTQPVFPMQTSLSYVPGNQQQQQGGSGASFQNLPITTDTYAAIPATPSAKVIQPGGEFFCNNFLRKEGARNANDPLPAIREYPGSERLAALTMPPPGVQLIHGIPSSYLHPPFEEEEARGTPAIRDIMPTNTNAYLRPTEMALRREPSSKKRCAADLAARHTLASALSTSEPYHVYQEPGVNDITGPGAVLAGALRVERGRADRGWQSSAAVDSATATAQSRQPATGSNSLEDLKQQIESGTWTGRVKKFRRPAMLQSGVLSSSTPNILQPSPELLRDGRLLHSNA